MRAWIIVSAITAALALGGCAMTKNAGPALPDAQSPALSVYTGQEGMSVWVSPVRQTMQIAGSYGAALGSAVSAVADSIYQSRVNAALGDYDARGIFEARLQERLTEALGKEPALVDHLRTTAGHANARDAAAARYGGLAIRGHDQVLDASLGYGIYGYAGEMVVNLDARLTDTGTGKPVYRRRLLVATGELLASDRLQDPTNRVKPNITSPRFAIKDDAIEQWTANNGAFLKATFEQAVEGVVSAALVDLGLADEPLGHHYLGRLALMRKDFDIAEDHFRRACAQDPALIPAWDGLALTLAHSRRLDEAMDIALQIAEQHPDHAPAHYNLAWWHAVEMKDAAAAKPHYDRALALGMAPHRSIDRAMKKAGLAS